MRCIKRFELAIIYLIPQRLVDQIRVEQFCRCGVPASATSSRRRMESDQVGALMWNKLSSAGLIGRKLAVFKTNDADDIAAQLCRDLGVIVEQSHVDLVSDWISEAQRLEPMQKRLRGDFSQDPLHDSSCMNILEVSSLLPVAVSWQLFTLWKMSVPVLHVEGCAEKATKGPELRERMNRKSFGRRNYTKSFARWKHQRWKNWSTVWSVGTCIWL